MQTARSGDTEGLSGASHSAQFWNQDAHQWHTVSPGGDCAGAGSWEEAAPDAEKAAPDAEASR